MLNAPNQKTDLAGPVLSGVEINEGKSDDGSM